MAILHRFLDFSESLRDSVLTDQSNDPAAFISRIRGTGPGVSFGRIVKELETTHPVSMQRPFEGVESIAGGVWPVAERLSPSETRGLVKLHFDRGTNQLPMHSHEHSDRVIFVLEGRGFFHVSGQTLGIFDGTDINSVPVRSRDALVFSRGTVHTFSCPDEPLVLLSYHHPYFSLDDPKQYTIPECCITPADLTHESSRVSCDPAWNTLIDTQIHRSRD
ncbi:cupin domain-containing protein [Planctomycetaceae bacterium AH-315-I19]|nr:cupin domain-containing protein [Planctomycetaceae bacterium AH-315-I19]